MPSDGILVEQSNEAYRWKLAPLLHFLANLCFSSGPHKDRLDDRRAGMREASVFFIEAGQDDDKDN